MENRSLFCALIRLFRAETGDKSDLFAFPVLSLLYHCERELGSTTKKAARVLQHRGGGEVRTMYTDYDHEMNGIKYATIDEAYEDDYALTCWRSGLSKLPLLKYHKKQKLSRYDRQKKR